MLDKLPVELVGTNVLGYLSLKDIVMLERSSGSKISHQLFLNLIPYCPPVVLPSCKHTNESVLHWFVNMKCKIESLTIKVPGGNPGLNMSNLLVLSFDLQINYLSPIESYKLLLNNKVGDKVQSVSIEGDQYKEVMEQLSVCTGNVNKLVIRHSENYMDWITADVLSRWKLKIISLSCFEVTTSLILLIVQTCSELTSIKVEFSAVDDAAVAAIAQHCPKLETLQVESSTITWTSLLALSERGLPLKELHIDSIPSIPTADIAKRCSHALSRIRYLDTEYLRINDQDISIILPYMTELQGVFIAHFCYPYVPLLKQYCNKLTCIDVDDKFCPVADILSLCHTNPLLERLSFYYGDQCGITDTTLIELIHACPHITGLYISHEKHITNRGILALSELCPQLQTLVIYECHQIKETTVLQLLQRCRKLTELSVSSSSLSKDAWKKLDKYTQNRVIRHEYDIF